MKKQLFLACCLLLSACAHHRDVRPNADGVHRVLTRGPDKDEVERDAIRQAQHYCESIQKSAAFVKEETKYTGGGSEDNHKNMRTASKVATAVGSGMWVLGGRNESNAGQVITGAGTVGSIATGGDAYTSDMRFKCQ